MHPNHLALVLRFLDAGSLLWVPPGAHPAVRKEQLRRLNRLRRANRTEDHRLRKRGLGPGEEAAQRRVRALDAEFRRIVARMAALESLTCTPTTSPSSLGSSPPTTSATP